MERIQALNTQRLLWCCDDYGITLDQLAVSVNVPGHILDEVVAGNRGLTFHQLQTIAAFFNRGVLFFIEPGPVSETNVHSPQFRTLSNQKTHLTPEIRHIIEQVEAQRAVYLSLLDDMDESEKSNFEPPQFDRSNVTQAAQRVREWLGLQAETKYDFETYRTLVEKKGILVFLSNGYNGKWQIPKHNPIIGFSLYQPVCPVIFIKKQDAEVRQTFTLMHELGHLLLHADSAIDEESDFDSDEGNEKAANLFAGLVLVPDSFVASISDANRPVSANEYEGWLAGYSKRWGVSTEVILRRLLTLGHMQRNEYAEYREWKQAQIVEQGSEGRRMYREREPKRMFGDTFVRTVIDALNARHITMNRASTYLDNIKIEDVHKLEKHLARI